MYNKKNIMQLLSRYFLLGLLFIIPAISGILTVAAQEPSRYGNFPYYRNFVQGSTPPSDEIVILDPLGNNSASFVSDGMRLTPALANKFGGVFIGNRKFAGENGIIIEFEYMIHGGKGNEPGATGGDGITLFFFNADSSPVELGFWGSGIGYSYNRIRLHRNNGDNYFLKNRTKGLSGAYLGIAFDAYGLFKTRRWQGEERRNGIVNYNNRNHITLRGAVGKGVSSIPGMDNPRFTGYPVLATQSTVSTSDNRVLRQSDGGYVSKSSSPSFPTFTIKPNNKYANENKVIDANSYRKAIVEIFPMEFGIPHTGTFVTVRVQHGADKKMSTLINDYEYGTETWYSENAIPASGTDNDANEGMSSKTIYSSVESGIPGFLKVGLAASTGASWDNHVIRNISIRLPRAAIAIDDSATIYKNDPPVTIPVLANDTAYTGPVKRVQVGSPDHIDPTTFKFHNTDGSDAPNATTYTQAGVGTWVYNGSQVIFTPAVDFTGEAVVRYSIRGGIHIVNGQKELPYADPAYQSTPATITVIVLDEPNPEETCLLSNKMISPPLR